MNALIFKAVWCQPCKMMAPVYNKVLTEMKIDWVKIDVDEDPDNTGKYEITSVPCLILLDKDNVVAKLTGAIPPSKLLAMIKELNI